MNKHDQIKMILNESTWKVVYKLSLPSIIGLLMVGLNSFVDAIFIGKLLGEEALIGTSMALPLTQIQFGIGLMIGSGVSSILSIAIGESDLKTQQKIWGTMIWLIFILSVITMLMTINFSSALLSFIGASGKSLTEGKRYYDCYSSGTFIIVFAIAGNMLIRGEGRLKESMIFSSISFLINIALNPIFIKTFHMGIIGSATATIVANLFLGGTTIYYYSTNKSSIISDIRNLQCNFQVMRDIVKTGFSGFAMSVVSVFQGMVLYFYIGKYGTSRDLLLYGVTNRIATFSSMPAIGLMRAMQPAIGINFGAKKLERLKSLFIKFSITGVLILGGGALIIFFLKEDLFALTTQNFELRPDEIIDYLILIAPLLTITMFYMGTGFFQAIRSGNTATFVVLLRQIFLFIPILILFSRYYGITGVFTALSFTEILVSFICLILVYMKLRILL